MYRFTYIISFFMTLKCPLCSATDLSFITDIIGYIEDTHFDLYRCNSCGLEFADPLEIQSDIYDIIYSSKDMLLWYKKYHEMANSLKSQSDPMTYLSQQLITYSFVSEYLKQGIARKTSIIEVGSGLWYLTYALNKLWFCAEGIDISNEAVSQARQYFWNFYSQKNILTDSFLSPLKRYDLLICLEVLEHIATPKLFIERLLDLVVDGGRVLITTPNRDFYGKRYLWTSDAPPVHLTRFSKKTFRYLEEKSGYKVEFLESHNYSFREENILLDFFLWRIVKYVPPIMIYKNRDSSLPPKQSRFFPVFKKVFIDTRIIREISNWIYKVLFAPFFWYKTLAVLITKQ